MKTRKRPGASHEAVIRGILTATQSVLLQVENGREDLSEAEIADIRAAREWAKCEEPPKPKPMKPKRPTKGEVARFYNETFLPKRREKIRAEMYQEKDPEEAACFQSQLDALVPVKASDLTIKHGWECKDSPTEECVYDWDHTDEYCIFCGDPQERK